jgi:hypothetical protein
LIQLKNNIKINKNRMIIMTIIELKSMIITNRAVLKKTDQ